MAAVDIGALQRLIGRTAAQLGEHPPPPGWQAGQVQGIRAVTAEELQLVQFAP